MIKIRSEGKSKENMKYMRSKETGVGEKRNSEKRSKGDRRNMNRRIR
jgi:hypothetical protein